MINESMIEEYTENIDTTEMIIEYYRRKKTQDLERYFFKIEEWLKRDVSSSDNKPLVIDTDVGVEKKTLLIKWMQYHQEQSNKKFKDLVIPHFAGTGGKSSNYFYAMYKILVALREHFDISQKVELVEDKIFMYFNYWLDICNKTIHERVVDDSVVVLIFDGIDLFRDANTGEETSVALWLSQAFPSRIKVIVTADSQSEAMRHFKKNGCKVLKAESEPLKPQTIIQNHSFQPTFIADDNHKQRVIDILKNKNEYALQDSTFMKIYLTTLLPCASEGMIKKEDINKQEFKAVFRRLDYNALETIDNAEDLTLFLLDYFSRNIVEFNKFRDVLVSLTIAEKGLSAKEVMTLTKINQKEWNYIVAIFETFLMKYKDLWKICDKTFIKAITQKYIQNNSDYVIKLHSDIADVLTTTTNSLRKLEEETYHLFQCKAYFRLKEAVTNIENFLLLFNPRNKFELCRYWQILEVNGFDPSLEYTTAIEGFDLRYRPSAEQTFMIILQISRFLQEFGDFETRNIPDYRHPPIVGGPELKLIGLKREIKKLGMYINDEINYAGDHNENVEELEHQLAREFPEYSEAMVQELSRDIYMTAEKRKRLLQKKKAGTYREPLFGRTEDDDLEDEIRAEAQSQQKTTRGLRNIFAQGGENGNNRKDLPILTSTEALNVDIPKNREEFKAYYVNKALEKANKRRHLMPKEQQQQQAHAFTDDDSIDQDDEEDDFVSFHNDTISRTNGNKSVNTTILSTHNDKSTISKISKTSKTNTSTAVQNQNAVVPKWKKMIQAHESTNENQPTFYYYKRWLWMMFPSVCMSYKNNYSRIIFECFSSPTKYISVADERERTMQALRLAIESKIRKELVYAKPGDKTQFAVLKHLKRGVLAFPSAGRSIKALPPIPKDPSIDLSRTRTPKDNKLGFNSSNKKPSTLGDLSPVRTRDSVRHPETTRAMKKKGNHLFVTGEFSNRDKPGNISFSISRENTRSKIKPMSLNDLDSQDGGRSFSKSRTNTANGTVTGLSGRTITFADQRIQNMWRNAQEAIEEMIRPTFLNNVFNITSKQVEMFETKVLQLKKDMDEMNHMNKAAAEKLKHFNHLENGLNAKGALDCTERLNAKLEQINKEIAKVEQDQNEALEQGRRLSLIIKVCNKNKNQNELWIHNLNYLVTNFKKVIAYEEKNTDRIQREIFVMQQEAAKIVEEYGSRMKEHQNSLHSVKKEAKRRHEIMSKIHETQERLQGMASETTEESSADEDEEQTTVIFTQEQMERIREKETKDLENLDEMREQVDKIRDTIGLDFETPKFRDFVRNLDKMSEFEQAIYENENDIEKLEEEYNIHSNLLQTLRKTKLHPLRNSSRVYNPYDDIKDEDKLQAILREKRRENDMLEHSINKKTKHVLDARNTLTKICTKIGLNIDNTALLFTQLPAEEIANKLQERIEAVKNTIPKEEFERFKKGKVDFNNYYKESGYDFEIGKTHIFNDDRDMGLYKRGNIILEQSEHDLDMSY